MLGWLGLTACGQFRMAVCSSPTVLVDADLDGAMRGPGRGHRRARHERVNDDVAWGLFFLEPGMLPRHRAWDASKKVAPARGTFVMPPTPPSAERFPTPLAQRSKLKWPGMIEQSRELEIGRAKRSRVAPEQKLLRRDIRQTKKNTGPIESMHSRGKCGKHACAHFSLASVEGHSVTFAL